jgi:hypothetical protein
MTPEIKLVGAQVPALGLTIISGSLRILLSGGFKGGALFHFNQTKPSVKRISKIARQKPVFDGQN